MKRQARALLAAALALALFSACSGNDTAPKYSSTQVDREVTTLSGDLQALQQETLSDPAVASIFYILQNLGSSLSPGNLSLGPATLIKVTTLDASRLVPLIQPVELLPREGINMVTDGSFTPAPPTDYEILWQVDPTTYADFRVDWDREPTVEVITRSNTRAERPVSSEAGLFIGTDVQNNQLLEPERVGSAELEADWYSCNGNYIDEPTMLKLGAEVGERSKLGLEAEFAVREGAHDTVSGSLAFSGKTDQGSFEQRLELSASGDLERDANCWFTDFNPTRATVRFYTKATRGGSTRSLEFSATFQNFTYDDDGDLTSLDVSGALKINGSVAAAFDGRLDDLEGDCPGANVNVRFADRTTTLQSWLTDNGLCSSTTASF